jgi:hypothetical protein
MGSAGLLSCIMVLRPIEERESSIKRKVPMNLIALGMIGSIFATFSTMFFQAATPATSAIPG